MKTPREDRGMLSRLPEDPGYWDGLTDRIVGEARPELALRRGDRREWWSAMDRLSTVLATGAVAAVVALVSLLPAQAVGPGPAPAQVQVADLFGIAPHDPLATPLLIAESPPTMVALVWNSTERAP